jgi:GNAT superfamily N-acetyltransferase
LLELETVFGIVSKHLPGQHDQDKHAPLKTRFSSIEVTRQDDKKHWEKFGLKYPSDDDLREAYGVELGDEKISITVYFDSDFQDLRIFVSGKAIEDGVRHPFQIMRRSIFSKMAEHKEFTLPDEYRQQGIGVDVLERTEEFYEKIGIEEIRLFANGSVGRYAWARMGFDFVEGTNTSRDHVLSQFDKYLFNRNIWAKDILETIDSPWKIAAWIDSEGRGSGKDFLLNFADSYDVIKRLDLSDEGYRIGKEYYKLRRQHGRREG